MAAAAASGGGSAFGNITDEDVKEYKQKVITAYKTLQKDIKEGRTQKGGIKNTSNLYKVMVGLNTLGEHYFKDHSSKYVEPELFYLGKITEPQFDLLNKRRFATKYEEESGSLPDSNEVSFSDAYRHAGLLNVVTWEVIDPATLGIELTDHVFTWSMIETLPKVLKGTPFIAIHADTEDGMSLLFPLPSGMGVNHVGGYRKSRHRHHRKTLQHYKNKSSHRKTARHHRKANRKTRRHH